MLPHLASRLFGTPLLVHRAKLDCPPQRQVHRLYWIRASSLRQSQQMTERVVKPTGSGRQRLFDRPNQRLRRDAERVV